METKIYVTVDDNGFPNGFWDMAACPADAKIEIPEKAIEITRQQYDDIYVNRASRQLKSGQLRLRPSLHGAMLFGYTLLQCLIRCKRANASSQVL